MTSAENTATRILLVEDHTSFRQALAFLLEAEPGLAVVAQAGSVAETREALKSSEEIDVAVVDLSLPDGDGVELIWEISEEKPDVTTLVLSASCDRGQFAWAVEAGAAGALHKAAFVDEVVGAVRRLRAGQALLSANEVIETFRLASKERQKEHDARTAVESLTPRELEILEALAEGLESKEIARRLNITVETERSHVANLLAKLGARSRLQALVFAVRQGLVEIR